MSNNLLFHKKTKIFTLAFLTFTSIIILSGCANHEPIKLGFAGGVTGKNASVAISARDALLLAVEEVNQNGGLLGRNVELIIKDDLDTAAGTTDADNALIAEGVPVIFGHYMSQVAQPSLDATKGKDVLLVSPTISASTLTGKDDQFFRLIVSNTAQGKTMGEQAIKNGGKKAILVYNDANQQFIQGVASAFKTSFKEGGGTIVSEYMIKERDSAAMLKSILAAKSEHIDSIMMVMSSGDIAMYAQLLSRNAINPRLYSATWGMTADVIREGGDTIEGITFPALFNPEGNSKTYLDFKQAYRDTYAVDPDFAAVYAYESAQVVFKTIAAEHSVKASDIKNGILKQSEFDGLQGKIVFDAYGDVQRPEFIVTVKNGKFVTESGE